MAEFNDAEQKEIKKLARQVLSESGTNLENVPEEESFNEGDYVPFIKNDNTVAKIQGTSIGSGGGGGGGEVTVDEELSDRSTNPVQNKAIKSAIDKKQDTLVGSGTGQNVKTINGESIVGSGNIVIQGGGGTGTVSGVKVGSSGSVISPTNGVVTIPSYEDGAQKHIAPTASEVKTALGTGSGTTKYLREDGTWATPPSGGGDVTGVKGDSESQYRTGNVSITKENIGLGNVGNFKAVSTVANQGLSNIEKENARTNIGAGTSNFSGSYNDLTNKPTIPCADKSYTPLAHSGLGRKNLELKDGGSNILTQEDFSDANTIYVIQYDFNIGNSTTYNVTIPSTNYVTLTSDRRKLAIIDGNLISTATISGTTYYYMDIPLAPYRTFTLYDTTNCVLLNNGTSLLGSNVVNAGSEGATVYVASTQKGVYDSAYTIGVKYYYASVSVPANKRIEILDYSKCVFLNANRTNLSWDMGASYSTSATTAYIASLNAGTYTNAYRLTDAAPLTIPSNSVLKFEGGSINNGTLTGSNTSIVADNVGIFTNIIIQGTWHITNITSKWFTEAGTVDNVIKNVIRLQSDDIHNTVTIEPGDYWISANERTNHNMPTSPSSHTNFHLFGNIKLRPHNLTNIQVFGTWRNEDVMIDGGGAIYGDKDGHIYQDWNIYPDGLFRTYYRWEENGTWYGDSTNESCHCVMISESTNVVIDDIHCYNGTGDGFLLQRKSTTETVSTNIILRNCSTYNTRRQGISVCCGNVIIENCEIEKVYGTPPMAGIDIEPDPYRTVNGEKVLITVEDAFISVKNTKITDCKGCGVEIYDIDSREGKTNTIKIDNVAASACTFGISIAEPIRRVDVSNSVFTVTPSTFATLNNIVNWANYNCFNAFRGGIIKVSNCAFGITDEAYNSDSFVLDCSRTSTNKLLYVEFDGCLIFTPNTNGVKLDAGTKISNCALNVKGITINQSHFSSIPVLHGNTITSKIIELGYGIIEGNNIILEGPLIGGKVINNYIEYNAFSEYESRYASIGIPTYSDTSVTGKYLIATTELGCVTGNKIELTKTMNLDNLFFVGSSWNGVNAYAVIANNNLDSLKGQNLSEFTFASKGTAPYVMAYWYDNRYRGLKLSESQQ